MARLAGAEVELRVAPAEPGKAEVAAEAAAADAKPAVKLTIGSYKRLFSTADKFDYLLMALGTLGGLGSGMMFPLFSILFGDFSNLFGGYMPGCTLPPGASVPPGYIDDAEFSSQINGMALQFLWLALGAGAAAYLQQTCWAWTGNRQTNRLRERYLRAVLRQDVAFFDVEATSGGLLQGLNEDSMAIQQGISDKVGAFLQHFVTFLVGYIISFTKGWDMTLVMVACLPFLAGTALLLSKLTTMLTNKAQDSYTAAGAVAQQAVSQMRTVAAYNGEQRALSEYEQHLDLPVKVGRVQGLLGGLTVGMMQFVMFNSYALALWYGAQRVADGSYTGGQVLAVLIASLLGSFSLGLAAPILQKFANAASASGRMFSVIDRVPAIDPEAVGEAPESVRGDIELRSVKFAYPARPDVNVFDGFDLTVPAGKTVALVGSSGSGKSTVVGLIERFYDPAEGQVLLDGRDLKSLKLTWLRDQVGLVSQEPTLFATTIYENIAMGKPGCSRAEVEAAAEAANALRFIRLLPKGFETKVGERGVALSGGQKQRIAIARAVLKNPKVLLLDEATSALDSESERVVQAALDRMVVGRTTVVVAHRLSTIKNADVIAVVQQGVIVEQGTHEELLRDPLGAYSTLVKLQVQAMADEGDGASGAGADMPSRGATSARGGDPPPRVAAVATAGRHSIEGCASTEGKRRMSAEELIAAEEQEIASHSSPDLADASAITIVSANAATSPQAGGGSGCLRLRKGTKPSKAPKDGEDSEAPPVKVPMSRLAKLNQPEWPYGVLGCIASAGVGAVQPAFALVIATMVSILYLPSAQAIQDGASQYAWYFFAIASGALVCYVAQMWAFAFMGQNLARRLRHMLFQSILRQEIGWFDLDQNSSGRLATVLSSDATYVRGAVADGLGVLLQNLACVAVGYGLAFAYDWRVALVVTGILPFVVLGAYFDMQFVMGNTDTSEELYGTANQTASEAFSSIRVIHAYNMNDSMIGIYSKLLGQANQMARQKSLVGGAAHSYSQFIQFATYSLIIWFGSLELSSCRASYEQFLVSFLAVLMAAMGLSQSQMSFPDLGKAQSAVQRVFPIIDRKPVIDSSDPSGAAPDHTAVRGELQLCDVTFKYPSRPEVTVFDRFNLTIPAGKKVALVGESGSGKSTVVGLIERFYDPLEGRVLLDGQDLRSFNVGWLRKQIGLVSQEPLLFATSILDNIKYGAPDATLQQVMDAARAANAHEFISGLPGGYDTQVGERGVQLSGGQKQRVAIARAVLKDPKILLLDEATSALDAKAEKEVQAALDSISQGRTTVVVAHRLSTIKDADVIAVVFRGVILEQGTHDQLMALPDGGYSRLVAAQMRSKPSAATLGLPPAS